MTEQRIRSEAVDYWSQHGEDDTTRSLADDLLDARARIKELSDIGLSYARDIIAKDAKITAQAEEIAVLVNRQAVKDEEIDTANKIMDLDRREIARVDNEIHAMRRELHAERTARETAEARARGLESGIAAVAALINESHGVTGLHLNGDVAPWEELLEGGRFEGWLKEFSVAARALRGGGE